MMDVNNAVAVCKQLIADKGRGWDWACYPRFRYEVSAEAKQLAVEVLDQHGLLNQMKISIETELNGNIHRDYVYRTLALALDDDAYGHHLTVPTLVAAKAYRISHGMSH